MARKFVAPIIGVIFPLQVHSHVWISWSWYLTYKAYLCGVRLRLCNVHKVTITIATYACSGATGKALTPILQLVHLSMVQHHFTICVVWIILLSWWHCFPGYT